jgi:membrane protein DedA with SNARE-associated domain
MIGLDQVQTLIAANGLLLMAPLAVIEGPIVTVIAAYLASLGLLDLRAVIVVAVLADLVGDTILYFVGRNGLGGLPGRWRTRLGMPAERVERLADHFRRKGGRTLVVGKLTHSAGAAVLVAAGTARMPFGAFLLFNLVATVPKVLVFAALGWVFGSAYSQVDHWIFVGSSLLFLCVLIAFGVIMTRKRMTP